MTSLRVVSLVSGLLTCVAAGGVPAGQGQGPPASASAAQPVPEQAFYHPDAPALFESLDEYLAWYGAHAAGRHAYDPARLTVGVYFHIALYQEKNVADIDALVRGLEHRGQNAVVLAGHASPALTAAFVRDGRSIIDTLVFTGERLSVTNQQASLEEARRIGVPILEAMHHRGLTAEEFAASPTGLHPELTSILVEAERDGLIEPIVISGKRHGDAAKPPHEPFPAQIDWRVDRALAWARLHRAANAEKRVVFTYWSEGAGKANVGGDPDDFLDVQGSLIRLLAALKGEGYNVGPAALPDRDTLARRMAVEASNVGNWAPGEIAARVKHGDVALVPEDTYRGWFDTLPAVRRQEIDAMWGPPPGDVMVYTDGRGKRSIVVPRIEFGNMLIAPHPDWGYLQSRKALMSTGALPPHHQYLAFFLWLQREWHADAWVPLFTNVVLQPGKSEGPAADDHIGILLGSLPHIHPERLGGNGGPGDKRKGLAQTIGWFNIVAPSDAGEQLSELRARLARYGAQPDASLRADSESQIRAETMRTGIDRALTLDAASVAFPELRSRLQAYLEELEHLHMPYGSKVLGDPPTGRALPDMVTGMLGSEFRAALAPLASDPASAARALVASVVIDGQSPADALVKGVGRSTPDALEQLRRAPDYAARLRTAPREIAGILEALSGTRIDPGPFDEPMHQPDALPPGRAVYNFDQGAIPTAEAEAVGVKQAEAAIATHREGHDGVYPTQLAFVVWSSEVARTHGVTEAEILHLLGTRPVRNARGQVTGVELIPRDVLGRPRVDVLATISGVYRDHYLDKVELIAEAVRLAAASPEADNPVAAATHRMEAALRSGGTSADAAATLARARVFGEAPGAYAPGIQFLAKAGDQRGDTAKMTELYTSRMSHAYGGGLFGASGQVAFQANLAHLDAATLPRSSNVNGLLDNPSPAAYLGGLELAARSAGRDIELYVSNLRDLSDPPVESASRALQAELRTRYFNPKWITEMKAHGYDGARNMMFFTDQLDLWNSTTKRMVTSADWAEVKSVYVDDTLSLGLDSFFEDYNPFAQQVMLANLLGAAERRQWNASAADLARVAGRLAESAARHGAVCEATICRNEPLTQYVERALAGTPGGAALARSYRSAIEHAATAPGPSPGAAAGAPSSTAALNGASTASASTTPPAVLAPAAAPTVTGRVLEDVPGPVTPHRGSDRRVFLVLAAAALALFTAGWFAGDVRRAPPP